MSAYNIDPQELSDGVEQAREQMRRTVAQEPLRPGLSATLGGVVGAGVGAPLGAMAALAAGPYNGRLGLGKALIGGATLGGLGVGALGAFGSHGEAVAHNAHLEDERTLLESDPEVLERVLRYRARNAIREQPYAYDDAVRAEIAARRRGA